MSDASLVTLLLLLILSPCLTLFSNPVWSPNWCSIKGEMRIVVMKHLLLLSLMIVLLLLSHKLPLHLQMLVLLQLLLSNLLASIHLELAVIKVLSKNLT